MKGFDSESDLDMTEVWPPVLPATRKAPAVKPGAWAVGVRKATLRHHQSPPGGPVSVTSTEAVAAVAATTAAPAVTVPTSTTDGDLPALVGKPARDLEVFGGLPALQSGRTRSQSRDFTTRTSYADALLAYFMRAVEAKKTSEEKAAEIERAHDSLLEERLEKERKWLEELERRDTLLD